MFSQELLCCFLTQPDITVSLLPSEAIRNIACLYQLLQILKKYIFLSIYSFPEVKKSLGYEEIMD